ncbi:hypothetical protein J437_LFUL019032 [Ladona fulva]|uniref:BolA-like protein 3 n=1 Tax=Ladona fulva TaxID=123851 RepID=A0A8K0KSZ8_LADFU|nr:hypothetical protein J437_LFUL019032 [Ladona fulva]
MMRRPLNSSFWRSVSLFSHSRSSAKREDSDKEQLMKEKLRSHFPRAISVEVVDISGGCGAMYEVVVASPDFKGLSIIKQHRLVNEVNSPPILCEDRNYFLTEYKLKFSMAGSER